ncbi:TIGR02391 family protein [Microbacterium sp. lyk4-40-TSB-66]|uniref:TIGR02391 family protein n=1 Tax=Microbacterium sp. lyk4-40-TSB-66 TaxID=3040294 RepID=UPI00254DD9A1|nr:TIGR02391 family protein [Microbacterium sp. lyk4-40-TSB-66]
MGDSTDEAMRVTLAGVTSVAVDALNKMSPSELGLLVAKSMLDSDKDEWSVPNFRAYAEASIREQVPRIGGRRAMPREYEELNLSQVLADAFGWLLSRGLLGPAAENSGATGEYRLTSAGRAAAESGDAGPAEAAYRLHADLHPALLEARLLFERGSYQTAVFAATHQVEVRVRDLANYGPDSYGIVMMRNAFAPETGPLASAGVLAERQAIQSLYAGTIGAFKNPASHRVVHFDNPTEVADIIHLADLLLRIAERSASGLVSGEGTAAE